MLTINRRLSIVEAVRADAAALGYDQLFGDRIAGATKDPGRDAKRVVMDEILRGLGAGETFAVFGDGPVEIREGRRRAAVSIGICSDERRRHGFNVDKRRRLIRAGAHALIADYTRPDEILSILGMA